MATVSDLLTQAITITSQYLVAWMTSTAAVPLAQPTTGLATLLDQNRVFYATVGGSVYQLSYKGGWEGEALTSPGVLAPSGNALATLPALAGSPPSVGLLHRVP